MSRVRTYTGEINILNPNPDDININDIAISLGRIARFLGHSKLFYSVAQHSVMLSDMVPEKYSLTALLHDAAEAYLGDIIRPVKAFIQNYNEMENDLLDIIMKKYGGIFPLPEEVIHADDVLLEFEWTELVLQNKYLCYSPDAATENFLRRFHELAKIENVNI